MGDKLPVLDLEKSDEEKTCKGRIFRCIVSSFTDKKGSYIYKEQFSPLKRMSCPGCEKCAWMDDYWSEIGERPLVEELVDGALYSLALVCVGEDWENGIKDYDLEFALIK